MMGSTEPRVVEQDFIYGDNDIISAKALRYRIVFEKQLISEGFNNDWILDFLIFIFDKVADF